METGSQTGDDNLKKTYPTFVRFPVSTKHVYNICTMLAQRLRRWADVVEMLYICFVLTGLLWQYCDLFRISMLMELQAYGWVSSTVLI